MFCNFGIVNLVFITLRGANSDHDFYPCRSTKLGVKLQGLKAYRAVELATSIELLGHIGILELLKTVA